MLHSLLPIALRLLPLLLTCLPFAAQAAVTIEVVGERGAALEHAVVTASLHDAAAGRGPGGAAEVRQVDQQFLPRVSVVAQGERVRFPNEDRTQHHVYSFSEARTFEIELYRGEPAEPIQFDAAGVVALGCNIHDWMLGYIFVTPDPLHTVTREDGIATFARDPQDILELTVWHPAARDPVPLRLALSSLEPRADGRYRVSLATSDPDPLDFERDPLQELFGGRQP